ncbi:DNA replication licensing factor MCM6 [Canna indica]|uniref:DNA replication licensing factor MCM6 n=1 Tax=Canna indica TaxID=4628 RepID=A0AAQ3KYS3_9LILI|nr:DNA replication licensing factor MCM6 [Canna indica]
MCMTYIHPMISDNEDGAAERILDQDAEHPAPEENGPALKNGDNEQGSDGRQKKKLVITEEHFQRVTQALVMRLRQHEETVTQGSGMAGMKQGDLIIWYVEQQNAQGVYI